MKDPRIMKRDKAAEEYDEILYSGLMQKVGLFKLPGKLNKLKIN